MLPLFDLMRPFPSICNFFQEKKIIYNRNDSYVTRMSGYFKAPKTGSYQFYVSGDQSIELYLSTDSTKDNLQKIAYIVKSSPFMFFHTRGLGKAISDPIDLVEGINYYMEIYHAEVNDRDHLNIGVKIPGIPQQISNPYSVYSISINCPSNFEGYRFQVGGTGGSWNISFNLYDDYGASYSVASESIPLDVSEADLQAILKKLGLTTQVTKTSLSVDTFQYDIKLVSKIPTKSTPTVDCSKLTNDNCPAVTKISSSPNPITGNFNLRNGLEEQQFKYDDTDDVFAEKMRLLGYTPAIRVKRYGRPSDGSEWVVALTGGSPTVSPPVLSQNNLQGCTSSNDITVEINTIQAGNTNDLFYETIPFNLLFTAHEKPQITVKSNGLLSNCPNFNCDYIVTASRIPMMTSTSYSEATSVLTVQIVGASSYPEANISASFGNVWCTVISWTSGQLTANCLNPEMGNHFPKIHFNNFGFADTGGTFPISVTGTITEVTPTQVNVNGGNLLTITGTRFPSNLEIASLRQLIVKIGDSSCQLIAVSTTQIQCKTTYIKDNC